MLKPCPEWPRWFDAKRPRSNSTPVALNNLAVHTRRLIPFKQGDCTDACVGTLLLAAGVSHPEDILFKDLTFIAFLDVTPDRWFEFTYRDSDYFPELSAQLGAVFRRGQAFAFDQFTSELDHLLDKGMPVAITVDHWSYEPSQTYRKTHWPHSLILEGRDSGAHTYSYLDPFPRFDVVGSVSRDGLMGWCDAPELGDMRFRYFYLLQADHLEAGDDAYLRRAWQTTLRHNVERMLSGNRIGTQLYGVAGIRRTADSLEEWIDCEWALGCPVRQVGDDLLDIGANRMGHAGWLMRVASVIQAGLLPRLGLEFHRIGEYWNTVSAICSLAGDPDGVRSSGMREAFILRKFREMPSFIRTIADREERVLQELTSLLC